MKFAPKADHSITPLFWQRADGHDAIYEEMCRMKEAGINDFIAEPRPHPDYLGEGWWKDIDFILEKAAELDMLVWLFDDGCYPSGVANGEIAKNYPQYTKRYWAENHIDAHGPIAHAHFYIDRWLSEGETLSYVIAARRSDGDCMLDSDTLTDLTGYVRNGCLYWAVPEGDWRIFVVRKTNNGLEVHTNKYCNPLDYEAVSKYIDIIHERHYRHYAHLFGTRIQGFFTDEPRFGNIPGYDKIIGSCQMPLPCSDTLMDELGKSPLGDFISLLPLLWYPDKQGIYHDARYVYMDTVSRLFAENFTGQIGNWCRAHKVRLIGHVVEENGAHSRLGYGAGHYFRVMNGLDVAGIDVVENLLPGHTEGSYMTFFNNYDCDFNHWGLAKMASSAAHADTKKHGNALCEAFGAYGWFEGLKIMKWITDHLAVQGVNIITPHAFSPSPFPDPDCPPHFYARGENPQFRYFHVWSSYAARMTDILTDASHIAPAAVLYHAEAEWGGRSEPFEKAVKVLAQHQIDCDVVCIDTLLQCRVEDRMLDTGIEKFKVLVIPYAQYLPENFIQTLRAFIEAGLPVFITGALPERCYFGASAELPNVNIVQTDELATALAPFAEIRLSNTDKDLLYTHYSKNGTDVFLFVNQSTHNCADTVVSFKDTRSAIIYDAMSGGSAIPKQTEENGISRIPLKMDAWESRMIVFGCDTEGLPLLKNRETELLASWSDGFEISIASSKEYPTFKKTCFSEIGDLSAEDKLPEFSGTVRYERDFNIPGVSELRLDLTDAYEAVSVYVNGQLLGERICPPYSVNIPAKYLKHGSNHLVIDVTNTLVKTCSQNPFDRYFVQEPTGITEAVLLKRYK